MLLKIAICTPLYGSADGKFIQCLSNLHKFFYETPIYGPDGEECEKHLQMFIVASSMLTESRHKLTAEAVHWGATHMLWLDGDHVFPQDGLHRLLSHNLPVVGCNYSRRCVPTAPTAAYAEDQVEPGAERLVYTTREKAQAELVEEVGHLGFGFCLIDMKVLDALQYHAEATGKGSYLPLYQMTVKEDGVGLIGEDVFFFKKLRDAGIAVHCDHLLSWELGHIGDVIMTSAMAVQQKDAWNDSRRKLRERYEKRAQEAEAAHNAHLEGAATE